MSTDSKELDGFVREALARGAGRDAVAGTLAQAGWPADQVTEALSRYPHVAFGVPVPQPRPMLSARDAFLHLVLFMSLYVAAWQLGSLLFDLVNLALPDPADPDYRVQGIGQSMRWSASSVVIAFPLFAFLAHRLSRELRRDPNKRRSQVRRWLTYMTLFLATAVLAADLVTLVYNVLGGELSARFLLKVLIAGGIAGAIFTFYLLDLRREEVGP